MSLAEGIAAKNIGQARALAASGDDWVDAARAEARRLADAGIEFTSEDVTNAVGMPDSSGAVGAVFSHLARAQEIEWTGRILPCSRTQANGSDMRVWRAYTGQAERSRRVLALVEEWMEEPPSKFGTRLTRAEKEPRQFAKAIRAVWGD